MKKFILVLLTCFLAIQLSHADPAAPQSDHWNIEDSLGFKRVGKVVASPNGKQVAFVTMRIMAHENVKVWKTRLLLKQSDGTIKQLIESSHDVSNLRWTPDGAHITYIDQGDIFNSIWAVNVADGRVQKLFEYKSNILSYKWSHNGKTIAFVAPIPKTIKSKTTAPIESANSEPNTRVFIVPVDFSPSSKTSPRAITPDTATISIFDVYHSGGFDWSPDDQKIVYAYQPKPGAEYANQSKLAIVDLNTNAIEHLPYTLQQTGNQPIYSPDGQWVAFRTNLPPSKVAMQLNDNIALNNRICVFSTKNFKVRCLKNTYNENPIILGWHNDSTQLFVFDSYKTTQIQFYTLSIKLEDSVREVSHVEGFINPISISLNRSHDTFGFAYEAHDHAPEPFISQTAPFNLKQVAKIQKEPAKPLGAQKQIEWQSFDGRKIDGILMLPPGYKPSKAYPVIVAVHGGPTGNWTHRYTGGCWSYGKVTMPICWSDLMSKNFIIFKPNPRGSGGYGAAFRLANFGDFGGGDYQDIMAGVDYLIKQNIASPDHLAIFGWSYGGYLAAWAITQTKQFKAAVVGAGLTNLISFFGTSDIPGYLEQFLGKPFWDEPELYLNRSPIMYTKNITTPTLIIGGANDIRVPVSQSAEFYTALDRQNKEVKWVLLEGQAHAPTDADAIYTAVTKIEDWLSKALN